MLHTEGPGEKGVEQCRKRCIVYFFEDISQQLRGYIGMSGGSAGNRIQLYMMQVCIKLFPAVFFVDVCQQEGNGVGVCPGKQGIALR
jgi:hypothetical protein